MLDRIRKLRQGLNLLKKLRNGWEVLTTDSERLRIAYKGETICVRSTKMVSIAEVMFYAGESCQHPDLTLQQWGNDKDDVGNAR